MGNNNTPAPAEAPPSTTDCLAWIIVLAVFFVICGLAWLVVSKADEKNRLETAKYVFASVIPLVASWMGAVIAHYFQKENLAAATQSLTSLASKVASAGGTESQSGETAADVMRKRAEIKSLPDGITPTPTDFTTIALATLRDKLRALNQQRLPLFGANDVVQYVIHLPLMDGYLQQPGIPAAPTLDTFLKDAAIKKQLADSWEVITESASLDDVQKKMSRQCKDVFVTKNGTRTEPVLGWITNDRLVDAMKA
jgi:hypothetical protein